MSRFGLMNGKEPQVFSIGVKELWEVPEGRFPEGKVVHTLGFPSDTRTYGGGCIYGLKDNVISIGYVTGLDYEDPMIDPHHEFQKFKTHPKVAEILKGGKMIKYGAKSINAGGYWTMPQLYADGVLIVGDSASFLNGQRIKGIHTAIKSGMLAAETIVDALGHGDFSANHLKHFEERVSGSWIYDELYRVRNFHASFQKGRWSALINLPAVSDSRLGMGLYAKEHHIPGYQRMQTLKNRQQKDGRYKNLQLTKADFDKATDVFYGAGSR
jgi:electron-transferring-flavoprotein dehydrogenase